MGTAIVAIPSNNDYVWELSSEKIPHMTLLFLGDQENNPKLSEISKFLEHAVKTSLTRFGLTVDRRGELGADNADVLFFETNGFSIKQVEQFRSYLLKNDDISKAYNSTAQFDSWTPHLTMGYPETPAKKDTRDYPGTSWVNFDRVAIWFGEYDGPEFLLPDYNDMAVSMSDTKVEPGSGAATLEEALAHFGVKGMHWGQRNAKTSSSKPEKMSKMTDAKGNKLTKSDAKWAGSVTNTRKGVEAYNKASARMNDHHIDRINNKPAYKNADFNKDSPLRRKYYKEYDKTFNDEFNKSLKEAFGDSPSGKYKVESNTSIDQGLLPSWTINYSDVKHTDFHAPVDVKFENGRIVSISVGDPVLEHFETLDDVMAHFGVKGMHWGVSRSRADRAAAKKITSPDHESAQASRAVIKKSGTKALSNTELKALNNRLQLEKTYNELKPESKSIARKGKKFAGGILANAGKQQTSNVLNSAIAPTAAAVGAALAPRLLKVAVKVGKKLI